MSQELKDGIMARPGDFADSMRRNQVPGEDIEVTCSRYIEYREGEQQCSYSDEEFSVIHALLVKACKNESGEMIT